MPFFGPTGTPLPPTASPAPPTPTSPPLAASVNGQGISLADYQAEITRFESAQKASGTDLATLGDYKKQVLDSMIDLQLLAQGAEQAGIQVSDADVSSQIDKLASEIGGREAVGAWLASNDYDVRSFDSALKVEMLAAAMVDKITSQVPESAEQVHARHILVATQSQAEDLHQQLANGADFVTLAVENSLDLSTRPAGGDLGWFPKGYLTMPQIEQAAFELQPGQISDVIQTPIGYDIVEVVERGDHPLSPDARRKLQANAVQSWLATQRQQAHIEMFVNP